jgi:sialate O-acetylesterase
MARTDRVFVRAGLALLLACAARADVKLPTLLADHMVVQRQVAVHIWGKAEPGEKVTVAFRGDSRQATTGELGLWEVFLPPGEAGGPFELTVQGRNTIVLKDVLVGDVWIAAGQSNMEWPIRWAAKPEEEAAAANYPRIRLFRAMHRVSEYAYDDLWGKPWAACNPETVADFSAAGYHFGHYLQEKTGVPLGLIQIAWGGTVIDSWTSLRAITADAALMPALAEWARMMQNHSDALLRYQRAAKDWEAAAAQAKAAKRVFKEPPPEKPVGPEGPWKPGVIRNAMIAPATRYPIRGVIWYQGESNTSPERAPLYGRLFRTMIQDWRAAWGLGDFPFIFVQLASFVTAPESQWPELREAQRQALALTDTAMVAAIDIGEPASIHPKNKREVGRRLALAARALAYGEQVEYSGPLFRRAAREPGALRLWFDHAGSGLAAVGGKLRGFEIAGADHIYFPAEARIDGDTVVVAGPKVPAPLYVRYGWADNPDCNLINGERLPAPPFRSEP